MRMLFKWAVAAFIITMMLLGSGMPLIGWPDETPLPPQDRFVVMCCMVLMVYAIMERLDRND
jgi:hypothetical protein